MRTKNKPAPSAAERTHVAWVKSQPCIVCDQPGPSDAHHIDQSTHFLTLPLCQGCHTGPHNGIHGLRRIWNVTKKTELSCLADLMEKLSKNTLK